MTDRKEARRRPHLSLVASADEAQRGVGRFRSRDTDALQPGRICAGRYRVMRRIAEGGVAEIYEAYDTVTNGLVALKTLQLKHRNNGAIARRSAEEARTLLRIRHPHLIRVSDAGVDEGTLYFVMDLLAGCDLRHLLVFHGALPLRVALDLVSQLAKGVQALHDQGVIHRDLKPENVFVQRLSTGRLHVTLLDLGAAKLDYKNHVTTAVGTHGTAQYMSPEQASGETKLGPKSDVYALGLILIELLLGSHLAKLGERPPYTLGEWTDWQRSYPKPDLRRYLPEAHPDLMLLLTGCIERLSRRVPDAGFLVDALAAVQLRLGAVDMDAAHRAIELPEVTSLDASAPPAAGTRPGQVKVAVDSHVTPRTPFARTEERRDAAPLVVVPSPDPPARPTPTSADEERDTVRMAHAPRFELDFEAPVRPAERTRPNAAPVGVAAARQAAKSGGRRDANRRKKLSVGLAVGVSVPLALVFAFFGAYLGARQPAAPGQTAIVVVPAPTLTATSQEHGQSEATAKADPPLTPPTATPTASQPTPAPAAPGVPALPPTKSAEPSQGTPPSAPAPRSSPAPVGPKPKADPWEREF